MKKMKKRGAIYGVITLLLCLAIYLNWSYVGAPDELLAAQDSTAAVAQEDAEQDLEAGEDAADASETSSGDYFTSSRLSREQARDEAISILKETAESESVEAEAKEQASAQIAVLAENSVTEARVENLIRAKGYNDVVVMLGNDSVNVVVASPEGGLQSSDAMVIKEIIVSETQMTADQIKIVEAA